MSTLIKHLSKLLLFLILLFASICIFRDTRFVSRFGLAFKRQMGSDLYLQIHDVVHSEQESMLPRTTTTTTTLRRRLTGPGSSPPRCAWKCGRCTPCKAVHVSVPPGTPVTAEYYPEAWRCKCGNRLYMPWA